MKYCKYCGRPIEENVKTCPFCYETVSSQNNSDATSSKNGKKESDSVSVGLIIISALFPIVGIILGFAKMGKENKAANKYLIVSTIGLAVDLLLFAS